MIEEFFDENLIDNDYIEGGLDSFSQNADSLFKTINGKKDKELSDWLISQGNNKIEKDLISMICNQVNTEHRLMKDYKESGFDTDKWMDRQVKQLVPEATDKDIESVKKAIEENLEKAIVKELGQLENETPTME
ncbi:MAG: hypothetical protein IJK41_00320 [Muribaculaceae bacterium]|nr:hypothetical protein [Muribaculaceae bacterium]